MKTEKITKLQKDYNNACNAYILKFAAKQGLEFEFWVSDDVGGIACFGDVFYFNMPDIVWDVNSEQPKGKIIDWLYDCLVNRVGDVINYFSYSKGLTMPITHKK